MKELELNNWLRYFLTGAIFVIITIYFISESDKWSLIFFTDNFNNVEKGLSFITLSLIVGSVLYVIHRASIYPIIRRLFYIGFAICSKNVHFNWDLLCPIRPAKLEIKYDKERWKESPKYKKLSEWGSQVHFLYCLAWILLLSIGIKKAIFIQGNEWIFYSFYITITLSIIHHYRYLYYELLVDD
jgi:hypothetical protein